MTGQGKVAAWPVFITETMCLLAAISPAAVGVLDSGVASDGTCDERRY